MADINTIIKIKSASGDTYDSLFPTTKSENVLVDGAGKTLKQTLSEIDAAKGAANGFVMADAANKVKVEQIPDIDFATKVVNKPTTVAGYGITDAIKKTGGTVTGSITIVGDNTIKIPTYTPTNDEDVVTKRYVDMYVATVAQGLSNKTSVKVSSTENVALTGLSIIDTIQLVDGDRVLLKNQTNAAENGIWTARLNAWTRPADFDESKDIPKDTFVFVEEGTKNADTGWVLTTDDAAITLGTTQLAFTQFSGAGSIIAGIGLTKNGNEILIANTGVTAGTYTKVTVNAQGQVVGTAALTEEDLPNISWAKITGGPTSTPTQIDSAVAHDHAHRYYTTLEKIAEDTGAMTFDGKKLAFETDVEPHTNINTLNSLDMSSDALLFRNKAVAFTNQLPILSATQPAAETFGGTVWFQIV